MQRSLLLRPLVLALGLSLAALCASCFDYELELELTKTGHGACTVQLSLPQEAAANYHVDYLGHPDLAHTQNVSAGWWRAAAW